MSFATGRRERGADLVPGVDADLAQKAAVRFELATERAAPPLGDGGELPAGPRLPWPVQTVALLRFRHRFVPWAHRRYGDVFTLRIAPAGRPLVLFSRPEQVKEIFAGDPANFHAGKGNAILGPIMGEHSLLLTDEEEHKRARTLLMPAFNGHALRGYADVVAEIAQAEVDQWRVDEEFEALTRMNRLTLEVILRVVFGVTDGERLAALRPVVGRVVAAPPYVLLGWTYPPLRRFGPWRRAVADTLELDRLIYAEIGERRSCADLEGRTDVLSTMMSVEEADGTRLSDAELRDHLVTLLLAGHETTASALAWTLYELGQDDALLAKAMDAAETGDDAYLEAVFKESMRLHPIIPMVVRTLMAPATVGGYDLPAGVTVAPSIVLSHARKENHPDPDRFRPERFLGQNPPANTWIPFGGGVRRCIGAGFSQMEGVVILREILSRYRVQSLAKEQPKVRNITSVPRGGVRVKVAEIPA